MVRYFHTTACIYVVANDRLTQSLDPNLVESDPEHAALNADLYLGCRVTALPANQVSSVGAFSVEDALKLPDGTFRLCIDYGSGCLITDVISRVDTTATTSIRPFMRPRMSTFPDTPPSSGRSK